MQENIKACMIVNIVTYMHVHFCIVPVAIVILIRRSRAYMAITKSDHVLDTRDITQHEYVAGFYNSVFHNSTIITRHYPILPLMTTVISTSNPVRLSHPWKAHQSYHGHNVGTPLCLHIALSNLIIPTQDTTHVII